MEDTIAVVALSLSALGEKYDVIQKKVWLQSGITKGRNGVHRNYREWSMEGWFLFGFIPSVCPRHDAEEAGLT